MVMFYKVSFLEKLNLKFLMRMIFRVGLLYVVVISNLYADNSPIGKWRTIDDETGQAKSIIEISEKSGVLSGRVLELLNTSTPNAVCSKCKKDKKDQPIQGLEILWGVSKDGDVWGGGKILDPKKGKTYKVRLTLIEQGAKLKVRGYIGTPALGRTQLWHRVEE